MNKTTSKLIALGGCVLFSLSVASTTSAAVYKCETDGRVSYGETPCPVDSLQRELRVDEGVSYSETGTASGWVELDNNSMPIEGAAAVWYKDTQELWIYLFPFPVDEDVREAMLSSRGNGHQFRDDEWRNPDPDRWQQTPFIVFQFLFHQGRRRLESMRHARFVSWQTRVPTTINFSAEESAKKQHFEQLSVTSTGMVVFSSASSDTFADRLYTWTIRAQAPLMEFAAR